MYISSHRVERMVVIERGYTWAQNSVRAKVPGDHMSCDCHVTEEGVGGSGTR